MLLVTKQRDLSNTITNTDTDTHPTTHTPKALSPETQQQNGAWQGEGILLQLSFA